MSAPEDPLWENRPGARKKGLVPEAPEGSVPSPFPYCPGRRQGTGRVVGAQGIWTREGRLSGENRERRKKEKTRRKG